MAFVELEDGNWINPESIEVIYTDSPNKEFWQAVLTTGKTYVVTDSDRARILKTAGFVKIKKEKNDE